jgi:tetratricopeptide (TPR) repeat protein
VQYDGAALQSGVDYLLRVSAIAPQAPEHFLHFYRSPPEQIGETEAAIAQINALDLNPEAKAIALATLYQAAGQAEQAGLVTEAIASLEPVAISSETPYVHRLLGDLSLQVGLLDRAEAQYQEVIRLHHAEPGDRAEWTEAQVGLANVAAARGDRAAAERWLRGAKVGYLLLEEGDRWRW